MLTPGKLKERLENIIDSRVKGIKKQFKKLAVRIGNKWMGNFNYTKYVVITSPRTGSNLLVSLLSSHKNVYAYGELFNHIKNKSCRQIWNDTFSKKLPYIKAVGFKIFYDHPLASLDREVWDLIVSNPKIKVIHLIRENLVRSHLSLLIAYKTNIWGLTPTMQDVPLEKRKVYVNVEKFIANLRKIRNHQVRIEKVLKQHPLYEVTYEHLIKDQQNVMNRIFSFINVRARTTTTNLRRQNSEPIKNLVQNYDEFSSKINKTEFSCYLNE
jgi:LPS sulfotransferase NodH